VIPSYDDPVKSLIALVVFLSAATASAQSLFVQGTAGADIKRFSADDETSVFDGRARVIAVSVGGHLMPHWTVMAELDAGAPSSQATVTSLTVAGRVHDIHNQYTSQRRGISALVGYETSSHGGVRFAYYAGLSFSIFRREITSDAGEVVLQAAAPASIYTDRLTGPIVGIDAMIRLAPHLALVPSLRAQGLPLGDLGGHDMRPSLGARVSF
jgi:hypothetical protein